MSKVIVYTIADGSLAVIHPTGELPIEAVFTKDVPAGAINPRVADISVLPKDREFRGAWQDSGESIEVDMNRAREIHMKNIRSARDRALDKLDRDFMRALGQRNDSIVKEIEEVRQKLRDIPQNFDLTAAQNPDELRSLWPEELK